MKSPPQQIVDDEAYELTEEFIRENARVAAKQKSKKSKAAAEV
jgi:hypothetical protein